VIIGFSTEAASRGSPQQCNQGSTAGFHQCILNEKELAYLTKANVSQALAISAVPDHSVDHQCKKTFERENMSLPGRWRW
jgi:hypothetical protein